jgi:hypothetical protein
MGYNTTVIIMNDGLDQIANDPLFGKKLADAIRQLSQRIESGSRGIDVRAGNHCNPATVIETHHADETVLVAVGGNNATILGHKFGYRHGDKEFQWDLLEDALDKSTKPKA